LRTCGGAAPQFVPLDFTVASEDWISRRRTLAFEPLQRILEAQGLCAYEALFRARSDAESDRIRQRVRPLIYGYGVAAAGAGAVSDPVGPASGGLASVLALMLRTLAGALPRHLDAQYTFAQFRWCDRWWRHPLVGLALWRARIRQAHSGHRHRRRREALNAACGFCGDDRAGRGGLRVAELSPARAKPRHPMRSVAPLRSVLAERAAAGQEPGACPVRAAHAAQ
jgi:hypothetical protein